MRRSIRLPEYDDSHPGAYFVTICAYRRACIFGEIIDGATRTSPTGETILTHWLEIPSHHPYADPGRFCPHAQLPPRHPVTVRTCRARLASPLAAIVGSFKSSVTRDLGFPVRQRNYYEHVVRSDKDLHLIRRYIDGNPLRWDSDPENPFC